MGKFCVLLLSLCCSGHLAGAVQVGRGLKTEIQMPTVAATTTSEATTTANITTTAVDPFIPPETVVISEVVEEIEKDTHCECLGWKEAFDEYDANCDMMGPLMCDKLLKKLPDEVHNHTRCLNMFPGSFTEQWCFVSSKCKYGFHNTWSKTPFEGARYKACTINTGQRRFGMLSFKETKKLAKQNKIDLGTLVAWSYPSYTWPLFIGSYFGLIADDWNENDKYES